MSTRIKEKLRKRKNSKFRIRKKISGTNVRPRLSIFKSLKHLYIQAVDDESGNTLASSSTHVDKTQASGKKSEQAIFIAKDLAKKLLEKGINTAVMDRNGYAFNGTVKTFADSMRESGVKI